MAATLSKVQGKHDLKKMLRTELAGYGQGRGTTPGALFQGIQFLKHMIENGETPELRLKATDSIIKLLPYILEKEGGEALAKGTGLNGLIGSGATVTISFDSFKEEREKAQPAQFEIVQDSKKLAPK